MIGHPTAKCLQCVLVVLSIWLWPMTAHAYHPFATDDTGTQGAGGHQFEVGYDWARSELAGVSEVARALPVTYTYGLADNLDLFVGVARATDPVDGWSNVGIGGKWRFFEDASSKLSLALKPEILLPVSEDDEADGLGNGETSCGLSLILTRETGFGEIHLNIGVNRGNFADAGNTDRKTTYRMSIAPVWAVADGWKLGAELGLQTNPDRSQDAAMGYLGLGMVHAPSDALDVSVGLSRDFDDGPGTSTAATLGLTVRF